MEKTNNKLKSKFSKEKTKKGQISIRDKRNGKEARVTLQLNVPGVPNPRIEKYGATEEIARQRLAEAILLKYVQLKKNMSIANTEVFSPECQKELEKFDEYMECVKQNQLKANGIKVKKLAKYNILYLVLYQSY